MIFPRSDLNVEKYAQSEKGVLSSVQYINPFVQRFNPLVNPIVEKPDLFKIRSL
jgi:hypothetical protein